MNPIKTIKLTGEVVEDEVREDGTVVVGTLTDLKTDEIYISKHAEVMVHNPMIPFLEYANANDLIEAVEELRFLEKMLRSLYVNFADIEEDDIKILMDNETFISPDDAVQKGFAHQVIDIKPRPYSMVAQKNVINMRQTKNILNKIISAIQGKPTVNQLYYNSDGTELEVHQANPTALTIGETLDW